MKHQHFSRQMFWLLLLLPAFANAQGTPADYERSAGLREKFQGLVVNAPDRANWIDKTSRFWYRKAVKGGYEFVLMDAETLAKKPAFDHEKLAAALSESLPSGDEAITALRLPFNEFNFVDGERAIELNARGARWRCDLTAYKCRKSDAPAFGRFGGRGAGPGTLHGIPGARYNFPPSSDTKVAPGYERTLDYVESSPADQLQPKYHTIEYAKPGDALDQPQPVLFNIETKKQIIVDNTLFPNPYNLTRLEWRKDSRAFTFEYNQRGHQVYRVIEVDAATGKPRAVISEEPKTFFCYSGKKYRYDLADGREIVWMSERDGWNHLYLYDGVTGKMKNQITKGEWVVRGVEKVDEEKRQIWFQASGMYPGKDPYFVHYYRINFDGSGLTALTEADANHQVSFSSDMKYYVDTWSRVDQAPISELRGAADRRLIAEPERGDIQELVKAGWRAPEVFTSLARDGKTDVWGVIFRPSNFDPLKKYPVIEYIYAGPQGSFVPKSFSAYNPMQSLAELGFIVAQVDGMGTSNRSKAFHDVAWKNLGDAGFPDRIVWHKAIAAKYPYYDLTRVGVYGHSAGGQSSTGGMLFHPEFYKAAVSNSGCHDNRMDKIWWNEQWMGWPLGSHYGASSNVDNAHRLEGKLLLVLGEMDTNVDPSSTYQVVNALIKANKKFDLLSVPGENHGTRTLPGMSEYYMRILEY